MNKFRIVQEYDFLYKEFKIKHISGGCIMFNQVEFGKRIRLFPFTFRVDGAEHWRFDESQLATEKQL